MHPQKVELQRQERVGWDILLGWDHSSPLMILSLTYLCPSAAAFLHYHKGCLVTLCIRAERLIRGKRLALNWKWTLQVNLRANALKNSLTCFQNMVGNKNAFEVYDIIAEKDSTHQEIFHVNEWTPQSIFCHVANELAIKPIIKHKSPLEFQNNYFLHFVCFVIFYMHVQNLFTVTYLIQWNTNLML